jgi:hypothetical protein
MNLEEALERVVDSTTLLDFVRLLQLDRLDAVAKDAVSSTPPFGSGANGWENQTIESFLEAATAWAEDTDSGISQGLAKDNPWRKFAAFLYCGKIYE